MTELVWSFFWLWHLLPGPGHSTPTPAGQLSIVGTAFSWPENVKKVEKIAFKIGRHSLKFHCFVGCKYLWASFLIKPMNEENLAQ